LPATGTPVRAIDSIRVVTFNIELGGDPDLLGPEILGNANIRAAGLYLIQEAEAYPRQGGDLTQRLATLLDTAWVYIPGHIKHDGTHGLAILSRYPIQATEVMNLAWPEKGNQRIAIRADIIVGDVTLPVVDVHLETKINITERIVQLRPAILDLPAQTIVAGDFNTNPYLWEDGTIPAIGTAQIVDTDQAPILDGYMRDRGFATPAANVGPTERKYGILSRLDAIYSRGFAVGEAQVERTVHGSDHWPVWVDVALR